MQVIVPVSVSVPFCLHKHSAILGCCGSPHCVYVHVLLVVVLCSECCVGSGGVCAGTTLGVCRVVGPRFGSGVVEPDLSIRPHPLLVLVLLLGPSTWSSLGSPVLWHP